MARIKALEKANEKQESLIKEFVTKVEKLDSLVTLKNNTIDLLKEQVSNLQSKCDRTEQYTMRPNLRILGVPVPKKEDRKNENVIAMVKEISQNLGVPLQDDDIFRAHRIGKIQSEKKKDGTPSGKKVQSIIVRFRSWEKRCALYRARPKKNSTPKLKSQKCPDYQSIRLDLAKSTRDLLDTANNEIKKKFPNEPEDTQGYAFADINCNVRMKVPGANETFVYFNDVAELNKILSA